MAFNFSFTVFETKLNLDLRNSVDKTYNKGYLKLGAPKTQRNLQNTNFQTIPENLNSHRHKVRLN